MDSGEKQGKLLEIHQWHIQLHRLGLCLLLNYVLESISVWISFLNVVYGPRSLMSQWMCSLLSTWQYKTDTFYFSLISPGSNWYFFYCNIFLPYGWQILSDSFFFFFSNHKRWWVQFLVFFSLTLCVTTYSRSSGCRNPSSAQCCWQWPVAGILGNSRATVEGYFILAHPPSSLCLRGTVSQRLYLHLCVL